MTDFFGRPRGHKSTRSGRVEFDTHGLEGDANDLAMQMMKATENQLDFASEHIHSIRWIETHGSQEQREDPSHFTVTEFELNTSSGKRITLRGPHIEVEIEGRSEWQREEPA